MRVTFAIPNERDTEDTHATVHFPQLERPRIPQSPCVQTKSPCFKPFRRLKLRLTLFALKFRKKRSRGDNMHATPSTDGETNNNHLQNNQPSNIRAVNSTTLIPGSTRRHNTSTGTGSETPSSRSMAINSHPDSPTSQKPIPNHIHFTCSRCHTALSYDIWNSCSTSQDSAPFLVPRQGPCNHCVQPGEAVEKDCGIIRCQKCLEECGILYLLRIRNQRLEAAGYRRVDNGWWIKDGFPGNFGVAPWDLVRYGPCTETFSQGANLRARERTTRPI